LFFDINTTSTRIREDERMATVRENTRKSGETTWSVLFRQGKRQSSRTFETVKAAEDAAELINLVGVTKALPLIDNADDRNQGVTVDELFTQWLEWKRDVEKKVTSRTLKDYRRDYDNWIKRPFGTRPADSVTELDVQRWVDNMGKTLDAKSVGDRHMLLGQMYRWGIQRSRRIVTYNPCTETQLPEKKKKAPKGFSLAEWDRIHAWAAEHEPDADDLLLFVAATGWRWQEVAPLRTSAVEDYGDAEVTLDDGRRLLIPQVWVTMQRVVRQFTEVEGEGKSRAAMRRINLPPAAARMVRRRMIGKGADDLLFTSPQGKRWHANNFVQRKFDKIIAAVGIQKVTGMGPHYLRHTHVMMLDRARVSTAAMKNRLGHEDIKTTINVYGGMIDNTLAPTELAALDGLVAADQVDVGTAVVVGEVVRELRPGG
jgi:integrase